MPLPKILRLLFIPRDMDATPSTADLAERSRVVAFRNRGNWLLPAVIVILIFWMVVLPTALTERAPDRWWPIYRIIIGDYLVFFMGWIAAFTAAWRWRRRRDLLEELVLTPLTPAAIGRSLFEGSLAIWRRMFLGLAAVEIALNCVYVWTSLTPGAFVQSTPAQIAITAAICPIVFLALARFHFESMRLAHWLFAVAALPGPGLKWAAIGNLFLIGLTVAGLTAIGSAVTGIALSFAAIMGGFIGPGLGTRSAENWIELWLYVSAIPGIAVVIFLKRGMSSYYQAQFSRRMFMAQWSGFAEVDSSSTYPTAMIAAAEKATAAMRMEETVECNRKPVAPPGVSQFPGAG